VTEEMLGRISRRAADLREPVTQVDPALQLREPRVGDGLGPRCRREAPDGNARPKGNA